MSVSHACSSVSTLPTHPLLDGLQPNLVKFSTSTCDSGKSNSETKWENFRHVESTHRLEAGRSANTHDDHYGGEDAQPYVSGAAGDDKSTVTIDDPEQNGNNRSPSRQAGSGCYLKTVDSIIPSETLMKEHEGSEYHLSALTRKYRPGSESLRTSLEDSQDPVVYPTSESKRGKDKTFEENNNPQGRGKQRRAVLDDLPGTVWSRICPHLSLDAILRLRMCNRALRRMLGTESVQPPENDELEPGGSLPKAKCPSSCRASEPTPAGGIIAAPPLPFFTHHRHYGTTAFPPTPPCYNFGHNRLMHTMNKGVGQSATPSSPLSLRRGGHTMDLQIPLSEETLSDSTVPLSPDEEVYIDMWIAAVAPNDNGDDSTESCPAEPAPPDFKEFRYEMGPVMQVPMIRAKL